MKVQNNLTKGINQDIRPRFQPEGTYRHARNKKKSSKKYYSGGLVNELQNKFAASIPGKIVGYHRLEERNSTLFFHLNGASVISIYNHNTDEVTEVVKDSDFGCTWNFEECKWIGYGHSDSKTLAPCNDLIIYWSSGLTYYKANIDELLAPERRRSISLLEDPCEYFRLFKKSSGPRLRLRVNKGGGRDLVPGQYFTVARLLDESGNTSNWGMIQGPAFLKGKFNKPTDRSRESLRIEAKGLSGNFSRIQIAVIPPVGSQEQDVAYVIYDGSYNTNGVTAEYYSSEQHKSIVPLAEILTKGIKFIRGENLLIHNSKLHLYRTVQEFNPKVQKWAQQAVFSAISYAVPVSSAHKYRSLTRDEVAAFGLGWQFIDKTWTAIGHTPGPQAGANDLNCGQCDLPLGHTSNNASLLQRYNTITGEKEVNCVTGGRQTTERELEDYPHIINCSEPLIEPRTSVGENCIDQTTQRQTLEDKIEDIDTRASSLDDCIDCASVTTKHDLGVIEGGFVNNLEQLTDLFKTDQEVADNCATGDHTNIPDAAATLYEEAVETAEKDEELTYRQVIKKSGGTTTRIQGSNQTSAPGETGEIFVFGTNKGDDCVTEDDEPIVLAKYRFGGWESSLTYPKTLDCDGEPLYGDLAGLPIRHHKVPDAGMIPPFISFQNGVESKYEPANTPGKDTYVVLIGLMVENVYIPSYEAGDIPKPLDEHTPYGVFMAKREKHNQSVLCRAYVTPTFKGLIGNKEYAVPRHALCSYANVDRSIDNEDSHLGEDWNEFIYNAHSPDIGSTADFFNADYVVVNGILGGDGRVYGLYDEGKDVTEEQHRLDRRGARGAINLTDWESTDFKTCIKGAEYAEFNTNLSAPTGIDYPLLNKYREGSIYFQTNEALPGLTKDHSFNVGGLTHEYPTEGNSLYVTFKRFNSQQYGSIESLQYIHTGLEGKGTETSVRGTAGDSFVQKWSHKRTSYVSDKNGNYINEDYLETATDEFLGSAEVRKRGVCDPPNRRGYRMREFLGFFNASQLPEDGDKREPKNMANGHPTRDAAWILSQDPATLVPRTDMYYPRTLAHLNHLCIESDVNLYYRSTNIAETREVFYEELQGLDVDSSINQVDPNEAWLNDWHNEQKQPTRKQMNKKAMIRFFLVVIGPLIAAGGFAGISTALEAGATALASPFIGIVWMALTYNILSGRKLDQFLGLPACKMDDEGAQGENNTKGLKDNWTDYNWGFSAVNDQNILIGMPQPYNTCVCTELTNVIYTSNRQIDTSPYDAFANFQAFAFFGLAGDSGQIQRMFDFSGQAYVQTTDAMFALRDKQSNSVYGDGGFEISPVPFQDGAYEGFFGTEDPNASIITKYGYISVDYEAHDITLFNGSIKSLTDRSTGLYRYWKNNTPFCGSGCRDAMASGGTHYAFGYDPEYELLLITKHDGDKGHTWSYDLESKSYVSEHDFVPDFYFWDRNKMFMVKDSQIYRANMEGAYSTYFGQTFPSSVDITVRSTSGDQFTFVHGVLDTEVTQGDLYDRDETYSNVTIWGDFVSTGNLEIRTEEENSTNVSKEEYLKVSRRELGKWKFNTVRANEISRDTPVVVSGVCGDRDELNTTNITQDNPVQTTKQFSSKFMNFRFEFNKNDREIAILGLDTYITQSDEGKG